MIRRLNPAYERLRSRLEDCEKLIAEGTLIHRGRNRLYIVETGGVTLCIKKYGTPNLFKSFAYRYLCAPKGLRAWRNSERLREAGMLSPEPVAYIQDNRPWGIRESYYICLYHPGRTLYEWGNQPLGKIRNAIEQFAVMTAQMHEKGLRMRDYTPGNILQTEQGFILVDTNRMRCGRVSIRRGLKEMSGLWMQPDAATFLAQTYAKARGAQETAPYEKAMRQYRKRFWQRFARRHHLSDEIIHHDLDGTQYPFDLTATLS